MEERKVIREWIVKPYVVNDQVEIGEHRYWTVPLEYGTKVGDTYEVVRSKGPNLRFKVTEIYVTKDNEIIISQLIEYVEPKVKTNG